VAHPGRRGAVVLSAALLLAATAGRLPGTRADTKSVEEAVLAVHAEMTRAGEAVDADRLFGYMLDTDKGSIIQNGVILATRQEALERVRGDLRGIRSLQYRWQRQYVTVLTPEAALLVAEGESVVTTTSGSSFAVPFAQTVVFVLRDGGWKAIHAHQSSPLAR
jgi:hypothetical protein